MARQEQEPEPVPVPGALLRVPEWRVRPEGHPVLARQVRREQ